MTLPSSTTSTAGSVTLEPISPASVSTVRTSSTDAFSCLPPQRTIAYTEELSLCLCGPNALFRLSGAQARRGARQLCTEHPRNPARIRPVRWHLRLSDPGRRRCLRRRLPVGARHRIRRARLPGSGPPPAPAAERLARRRAVPGRLGGAVLVIAMTGRGTWAASGGRITATGGGGIAGA